MLRIFIYDTRIIRNTNLYEDFKKYDQIFKGYKIMERKINNEKNKN